MVPSSKLPVATNCCELASGTVELAGPTASETRPALVTLREAGALVTDPKAAMMLVSPAETPSALPCVPGDELIVAADEEEPHPTSAVMSTFVPSL